MLRVVPPCVGVSQLAPIRGAVAASSISAPAAASVAIGRPQVPSFAAVVARRALLCTRSRAPRASSPSPPIGPRSVSSPIMATLARASTGAAYPRRAASTDAKNAAQTPAGDDDKPMDWNTFFMLRKQRRRLQLAFSTLACLGGGTAGALFLSTGTMDSLVSQLPLDPFITLGLMTFGFAALGWLLGPILGTTVFNMIKRNTKKQMTKVGTKINIFQVSLSLGSAQTSLSFEYAATRLPR